MMFLQFFVWGCLVYLDRRVYMTNHGMEKLTHWPYTVIPDRRHRGAVLPGARGRPLLRDPEKVLAVCSTCWAVW